MFIVRHRHAANHVACAVVSAELALYVAVEFYARDAQTSDAVAQLVARTIASYSRYERGTPHSIAESLHAQLQLRRGADGLPTWMLFASVLLEPTTVEVCVAGSFRVHLLEEQKLVGTTRQHVLREDPFAGIQAPAGFEDLGEITDGIVTRCLGRPDSLPAESSVWQTGVPYRVVVCSSDFHQDREPVTYLKSADVVASGEFVPNGLIAILDRREPS